MMDSLSRVKSLLLTLERPAKLFLSPQELPDRPLRVAGVITTRPSFPLWPACADILYNSQSRIFVGVSYLVNEENARLVRDLCYGLADEVVRYNDFTSEQLRRPYNDDDFEYHRLEITWTDVYADKFEVAQLDSGFWYYSKSYLSDNEVIAFGLTCVDEVLDEYDLVLPDTFHLPLFEPEFIENR